MVKGKFSLLLCGLAAVVMLGCQGPAGKQGPIGPNGMDGDNGVNGINGTNGTNGINGTNGTDANTTCNQCHSSSQVIVSKQYQWEISKHATGETFIGEGSNPSCIKCHNGAAFIFPLTKADSAAVLASPSNVNCRTCHQIHSKFDSTDWALTVSDTAKVPLIISPTTKVSFGKGNLCVNCHQTRTDPMAQIEAGTNTSAALTPGRDSVKFTATAARLSAHYGSQTEIFFAKGAWLPDSGKNIPNTDGTSPHVDAIKDGCVTCHLGANHTFEPVVATCKSAGCHTAATTFDVDTVQTKVAKLSDSLLTKLVTAGIAKRDSASIIGYSFNGKGKTFPKAVVGGFVNLQLLSWDGSKGVHNGPYTIYLLEQSIKAIP